MHSVSKILTLSALVGLGLSAAMPAAGNDGRLTHGRVDRVLRLTLQGISHPEISPLSLPTPRIVFQPSVLQNHAMTPIATNFAISAVDSSVALVVTMASAIAWHLLYLAALERKEVRISSIKY